jgi:hypothetical protein
MIEAHDPFGLPIRVQHPDSAAAQACTITLSSHSATFSTSRMRGV